MADSIEDYYSEIAMLHDSLSRLRNEGSYLSGREMEKARELAEKQRDFEERAARGRHTSYDRDRVEQASRELQEFRRKASDVARQIAGKMNELSQLQKGLHGLEARERERQAALETGLREELQALKAGAEAALPIPATALRQTTGYDVFISHASEDKDDFVRPLAQALETAGCKVWYDEFQLKVGDSLRRAIDNGLAQSRYGIVVLSSAFFSKNWPQYELDGLVTRENRGIKVILPIWHKVSRDEVISYSPSLADKIALNSGMSTVQEIAAKLIAAIAPRI